MARLRRRVVLFACGALLVMAVLPAVNLAQRGAPGPSASELFDTGFAWPALSGALRRAGISTRPQQVVVGKSGWLFLGDQYAEAISAKRRAADAGDRAAAVRARTAAQSWAHWLRARGVADWHVLVCADKDGLYADLLPDWARPAPIAPIDAALQAAAPGIVVDSRPALRGARALAGPALYLRTDSHWTARGAWIAYRALAQADAGTSAWLTDVDVRFVATRTPSGDLARMLAVSDPEGDSDAGAVFLQAREAQRTLADATTARPLNASALAGVEAPTHPLLIRSPQALNARRLLWLRDSFGAALLPYIAATFVEVVEVDRESTTPAQLAGLVRRFRPDSVLVSVVERNARAPWFEAPPPASAE